MRVYPNNTIRIKATFKNPDKVAIDPTTVTLQIIPPEGSIVTFTTEEITNPSEGTWYVLYTPTIEGHYDIRWEAGTPSIASEAGFDVQTSRF